MRGTSYTSRLITDKEWRAQMEAKVRQTPETFCNNCNAPLRGKPIAKDEQYLFGETHFGRKIGLYSLETDRTYAYKCPDCGFEWSRESETDG